MKVILIDDVPGLGMRGDTVNVAAGYARNFLLPQSRALRATPGTARLAAERNRAAERREVHVRTEAQERAKKLDGAAVEIEANAGEEGKLYGSVTVSDVLEKLVALNLGFEIERKQVALADPIKSVGTHAVTVRLFRDVTAAVNVTVWSPQSETASESAPETASAPAGESDEEEAESHDETKTADA